MDLDTTHQLLGPDVILPEEIAQTDLGIKFSQSETARLYSDLPCTHDVRLLQEGNYGLIPTPPFKMSLLDLQRRFPDQFYVPTDAWYLNEPFAQIDQTVPGWIAIKKTAVPHSMRRTWSEQLELLFTRERVPNVSEIAWFMIAFNAARHMRLFSGTVVRTASRTEKSAHVDIGQYDANGFRIGRFCDTEFNSVVGIAVARS